MSSKDGLAQVLLEKARREEERRREVQERERQSRMAEERERRERERKRREKRELENKFRSSIEEAMKGADEKLKEMKFQHKAKKLIEYMTYYFTYHNMVEEIEEIGLTQGLLGIEIENVKQKFLEINIRDWPEPYRTRCSYEELEKAAFSLDPENAYRWLLTCPPVR